jgi:diguanylate cyclase (GGDEF)-like protein
MSKKISQRSAHSKMLLALSFGTAIGIFPFTIYRMLQEDWSVAFLDLMVIMGMTAIFIYVYVTDKVKNASIILVLVALMGNVVSFYLKGINQVYWIYPAMLVAYYIMNPRNGVMLNFFMLLLYIPKIFSTYEAVNIATILITVVITNVVAFVFASGLRKQELALLKLASEDYLTSTGNRRALNDKLLEVHSQLKNHDRTASIIILDLDHFKKVNDTHGHIVGDNVLIKISNLLKEFCSDVGSIYRFGGEEFLLVCPSMDEASAYIMADDIRKKVKKVITVEGNELTISLGVAEYQKEESIESWIHRVDLALYQAKNQGRDCVIKA